MLISELEAKLKEIRKAHGDGEVLIEKIPDEWDGISGVKIYNYLGGGFFYLIQTKDKRSW